jgi:hypothetical protein
MDIAKISRNLAIDQFLTAKHAMNQADQFLKECKSMCSLPLWVLTHYALFGRVIPVTVPWKHTRYSCYRCTNWAIIGVSRSRTGSTNQNESNCVAWLPEPRSRHGDDHSMPVAKAAENKMRLHNDGIPGRMLIVGDQREISS